jgi:hypothetical protein
VTVELILHAGQHKTGTTSIQAFLRDHRAALAGEGMYVPRTGMAHGGTHRPLVDDLLDPARRDGAIDQLRLELEAAQPGRVLISAERLKLHVVEGRGGDLIRTLRRLEPRVIKMIVYLRSPFALANAAYSQRTAALSLQGQSFAEHVHDLCGSSYFDYVRFLNLPLELVVRPFSAEVRRGVLGDFLRALGIRLAGVETEPRLNASFGPMSLEIMREFGPAAAKWRPAFRQRAREALAATAHAHPEEPLWAVDDEVRRMMSGPDALTESFAVAVWGRSWRDVIGDEDKPLNVYRAETASPEARRRYAQLRQTMRSRLREVREPPLGAGARAHG